jgi:hypothetical protein
MILDKRVVLRNSLFTIRRNGQLLQTQRRIRIRLKIHNATDAKLLALVPPEPHCSVAPVPVPIARRWTASALSIHPRVPVSTAAGSSDAMLARDAPVILCGIS